MVLCPPWGPVKANEAPKRRGKQRKVALAQPPSVRESIGVAYRRKRRMNRSLSPAHLEVCVCRPQHSMVEFVQEATVSCRRSRVEVHRHDGLPHPSNVSPLEKRDRVLRDRLTGSSEKDLSKPREQGHRSSLNPRCHFPDM